MGYGEHAVRTEQSMHGTREKRLRRWSASRARTSRRARQSSCTMHPSRAGPQTTSWVPAAAAVAWDTAAVGHRRLR